MKKERDAQQKLTRTITRLLSSDRRRVLQRPRTLGVLQFRVDTFSHPGALRVCDEVNCLLEPTILLLS